MERKPKIVHFIYVPFTGLGLYNGYRGDRWLKNRITIFKTFVIPSIKKLWKPNMVLWISWRPEDRNNPQVQELFKEIGYTCPKLIFTYHGVCFWDDKYSDDEASERLMTSLRFTMPELYDLVGKSDKVWMTIQPSDDIYLEFPRGNTGYSRGYIANYLTGETAEYNPTTTPPFYTIEFDRYKFVNPWLHYEYTGPYKSHEYVGDYIKMNYLDDRKFIVGVHGENISTGWDIPFKGIQVYGLELPRLDISRGWRRTIFFKLPHRVRRKLRYVFGEKFYAKIHKYVTNH